MLVCMPCSLVGRIVALDVLEFPEQPHVPAPFTLWRCPECGHQGESR